MKNKKINIIDPSSTEFNRGSFCYAPYLCYNGLHKDYIVTLYESFCPEDLDGIQDADIQLISLWSYPQIETAVLLYKFLQQMFNKRNIYFVGYTRLIKELGLPHCEDVFDFDPLTNKVFLLQAMKEYPHTYQRFNRLLLSDCDMHLKNLEVGSKVYPLFTTYGCPNKCSFCPSTLNCNFKRFILPEEDVFEMLRTSYDIGVRYIHFTDEDFFFNIARVHRILQFCINEGLSFEFIALGSAGRVRAYLDTYGSDILQKGGMKVVEVGFESGSVNLSTNMGGGKSLSDCVYLAEMQATLPFQIFWLTLTFFPGETLQTLKDTGEFLDKYGFNMDEVVGRLRTNGTKGGLGQFFQLYAGTFTDTRDTIGTILTERPIRLLPSFLPNSFLHCKMPDSTEYNSWKLPVILPWLALYGVTDKAEILMNYKSAGTTVYEFLFREGYSYTRIADEAIALAIFARLGGIKL